jgi:di/tricarboxylate transporter
MFPFVEISDKAPSPERHRRFRGIVGVMIAVVGIALFLQSTSRALLPARKTSTLWGVLTGIVLMTAYVEWRWSRSR